MNSREHQSLTGPHSRKQYRKNINPYNKYHNHGPSKQLSKQQFLQANCQFVVVGNHGYDYSVHLKNPDLTVPWEYIEQVRFRQTGSTAIICPICLCLPNAAQITKCGHIFCFSCVLHYLAVNGDKKCPVCFGPLDHDDLKSVVCTTQPSVSIGDEISLRLMHRRKGRVTTEPHGVIVENQTDPFWHTGCNQLANLIIVDPSDVVDQVTKKEREELIWRQEENEESEICFVEQALDILNQRLEKLVTMTKPIHSSGTNSPINNVVNDIDLSLEQSKTYLFYQSDSEHVYLNPFCNRILTHEFGSMEDSPRELTAKIVGLDCVTMNEASRKRFKYLEHLPLSCEFRLVEIELKHLISLETYEYFQPQIISREKERERRRREEQKRDKIIEVQQNRKIYGIMPTLDISLDSREQFPSVSDQSSSSRTFQSGTLNNDIEQPLASSTIGEEFPSATVQQQESLESDNYLPEPMSSFIAIQMQEERDALKNSGNNSSASPWAVKSGTANQSSFAKLLVDAKQKTWTRNSKSDTTQSSQHHPPPKSTLSSPSNTINEIDGEFKSRGPANEFTLNDFLETHITTSKKSRKPKNRH